MRKGRNHCYRRITKFFYIGLSHDSLINIYHTNFSLMQHHGYSLTEIENMFPFEKHIYLQMLLAFLEEEQERMKQQ